jgi:hypothetical protein
MLGVLNPLAHPSVIQAKIDMDISGEWASFWICCLFQSSAVRYAGARYGNSHRTQPTRLIHDRNSPYYWNDNVASSYTTIRSHGRRVRFPYGAVNAVGPGLYNSAPPFPDPFEDFLDSQKSDYYLLARCTEGLI